MNQGKTIRAPKYGSNVPRGTNVVEQNGEILSPVQRQAGGEVRGRSIMSRFKNQLLAKDESGVTHAGGATHAEGISLSEWITQPAGIAKPDLKCA